MKHAARLSAKFLCPLLFLFGLSVKAQQTATATPILYNGFVVGITVTDGGSGYGWAPSVSITGGGGAGAGAYATISGGVVTAITVTNAGFGYTNAPQVMVAAPSTTPFSSSLILDLPLDGSVVDVGPNYFTVTTNGGGTFVMNRYFQPNSALSLNGVNQNIEIAYDARLCPDEMTLSAWMNFQQLAGTVWRIGNASSDGWRGFQIQFAGDLAYYADFTGSELNTEVSVGVTNFVVGSWYQIVVTRTTNSCALFVNGVKVDSQANLTPYAKAQVTPMSLGANNADPSGSYDYCAVTLDTVHIYNRALSDSEVQTLYADEAPQIVPVLGISTVVRVNMQVVPGRTYQLQSSTDLNTWVAAGAPFTATNTTAFQDFDIGNTQEYFRLLAGE